MKQTNETKKVTKILIMITIIILLAIAGKIISTTLCEEQGPQAKSNDVTDYDFTDELEEDRIGIGFVWTAKTKTLTITGVKNNSARIILPDNSIIDIQGSIENKVAELMCEGNLTVRGNDVASLKIIRCSLTAPDYYKSSVYVVNELTIESGHMIIECSYMSYSNSSSNRYAGIYSKKIIINGGKITVNIGQNRGLTLYAIVTDEIIINDGRVYIDAKEGAGINAKSWINGGIIDISTYNTYNGISGGFSQVPQIDPLIDWKISYGKEDKKADITDIYNIYGSNIIKISEKISVGDLNGDGDITGEDAVAILKSISGNITLDDEQKKLADINKDGEITGEDAVLILKYIAGNIESL